ncbi:peptidylprolyl isomerase [Salipiger abyssi]|uniref:Parvulin-like PPIase n=1 Tax=Salipiger abyssi TaxID=1250539 RepID=A0A1P8UYV7_9RHOB|nr:peptidylprolyl isomerase [Salipiger abyssi]APZ54570.1 periplasmic chaperone for outer membrane proteins SurA [Salipiger abyssi]
MQLTPARLFRSLVLATGLALAVTPATAPAQGLFAPAITVDEMVITQYEIDQRAQMLTLLNAPGNPAELAREQLIDDRLRLLAAREAGIEPSEQEILDGMEEFAGRAELSREEFITELARGGVAEETFRDFIRAGTAWRTLVQGRFAQRAQVSPDEIDRALAGAGGGSDVRVLLSELIMPMTPQNAEEVRARAARISQLTSLAEFSAEARRYSATATRGAGGRLPWRELTDLPPQLRPLLLGLAPGEVTDPLPIPGAIALFQLRDIEETGYTPAEIAAVEYAAYYMPGGRSPETLAKARVLAERVDRCDDLYGVAKGQPENVLDRGTLPPAEIPTDIAYELSKLDPGEVSTALTRSDGQTLVFLMLCGRTAAVSEEADRAEVEMGLRNRRVGALADAYLAQLRANARIVEK